MAGTHTGMGMGKSKRLSKSPLWELQRNFYQKQGSQAWSKHIVPSYATSNPFTVRQYVRLALAYLRDCVAEHSTTPIDLTNPIHIFDLGAGSGQCAYLFLRELLAGMEGTDLEKIRLRYVMTDITENNLLFLVKHPFLKPYFQAGVLDVAYYDHHFMQEPLHLFFSKIPIEQGSNPIILICNYFFDTLPHDLFRFNQGQLEEGRVALSLEPGAPAAGSALDPDLIPYIKVSISYHPVEEPSCYYPDLSEGNAILEAYRKQLEGQPFLLPVGGLQAMRYFSWLSKNRMLVLVGDHGPSHLEQLKQADGSWMTRHGNFSIRVNFDAIAKFFQQNRGFALLPEDPDPFFVVAAFALGGRQDQFRETTFTYQQEVDNFQMRDYWQLVSHAEEKWKEPDLEQILLLIKFGNWDPLLFQFFIEKMRGLAPETPEAAQDYLEKAIDQVWAHFYPVSQEEGVFASSLGELLFLMKRFTKALDYFQRSLETTGYRPSTYLNMGAVFLAMQDKESAWSCYQLAVAGKEQ